MVEQSPIPIDRGIDGTEGLSQSIEPKRTRLRLGSGISVRRTDCDRMGDGADGGAIGVVTKSVAERTEHLTRSIPIAFAVQQQV